jgi:dTDP-4-dehydrorhamnose reductase
MTPPQSQPLPWLLFGASGQLGSTLREIAPALGMPLLPVTRADADLSVPGAAQDFIARTPCAGIINAAGFTKVDLAEAEPDLAFRLNRDAVAEIARACAVQGLPLIHLSTDYVFDGTLDRPLTEDDTPNPLSVYGRSKLAGEHAVAASGARAVTLRVCWLFGVHGQNFVKTMLRLGLERGAVRVVGDQWGCPTPADHAARVVLAFAAHLATGEAAPSPLYHVSATPPITWAGLARAIFARAGLPVSLTEVTSAQFAAPARRPLSSVMDTARLMRDFAIPAPDWRPALAGIVAALHPTERQEPTP